MPIDQYEPVSHIVLRSSEAISAYANPTRIAILAILAEEEATLSMVASRLSTTPANLSHHVRKLLENRLIVLIETRATSRNVEKYYRASAYSYSIELDHGEKIDERSLDLARFRDELVAATSRRLNVDHPETDVAAFSRLSIARIKASDAEAFRSRLEEIASEFMSRDDHGGEQYALALALFPSGSETRDRRSGPA